MTLQMIGLLIVTGLGAGFAGGLFGIGGGVIIVPALYAVFVAQGVPEAAAIKIAIATSMATIIVTSIRSTMRHHRHENVEWAVLRAWAPAMAFGAVLGTVIARYMDGILLTGIFGAGLILLAGQRFLSAGRSGTPRGQMPRGAVQAGIAAAIGSVSSLLGIGGGVLGVLTLTQMGRTVHRAVGTAAGFGLVIAVPGTLGYLWPFGNGAAELAWQVGLVSLPAFLAVASGTFFGAPLGATTASKLSPALLTRIFATYAAFTGVMMLLDAIRA